MRWRTLEARSEDFRASRVREHVWFAWYPVEMPRPGGNYTKYVWLERLIRFKPPGQYRWEYAEYIKPSKKGTGNARQQD